MSRLAGKGSHQAASFTQSRVLMQLIASTSLSVEEVVLLMDEVEGIVFTADDQACVVEVVTQKSSGSSAGAAIPAKGRKRQDYESLIYFCPTAFGKPALGKAALRIVPVPCRQTWYEKTPLKAVSKSAPLY